MYEQLVAWSAATKPRFQPRGATPNSLSRVLEEIPGVRYICSELAGRQRRSLPGALLLLRLAICVVMLYSILLPLQYIIPIGQALQLINVPRPFPTGETGVLFRVILHAPLQVRDSRWCGESSRLNGRET
jgi:hypothetical protein